MNKTKIEKKKKMMKQESKGQNENVVVEGLDTLWGSTLVS